MTSAWDIPKNSPFTATRKDRRNFSQNNGARGGKLPTFVLPGSLKTLPPTMMRKPDGNIREVEQGES